MGKPKTGKCKRNASRGEQSWFRRRRQRARIKDAMARESRRINRA
jgi:hypothetical protein